jgi:GAF domain-containing protein
MDNAYLFRELVATYRKHGCELRRALLQPTTLAQIQGECGDIPIREAEFDALWFARPSHQNREAWELRLLAQTQYALFEAFEPDETEEQRDEVRREMEARLREYLATDVRMKTD